ncbi:methyltransferase, partial [Streptomyces apricus]
MPPSYDHVVTALRSAGCVFAEDEARLILSTARTPAELTAMVDLRAAGRPLEHVLGWAEFSGLRIAVEPGVFVPRRRTEFLVRQAVRLAPRAPVVVDLCCGSGAVGAALVAALPGAELHAADIAPAAVRLAPRAPVVVDLCCGSGAVGAALVAALPGAELHAADIDPAA